jgi:hypothetical protein
MSLTLDRLEAIGLLLRSPDPTDGRRVVVALTEAGTRVATMGYSGKLYVWEANDNRQLFHQQLPATAGYSLAYSPDGKEIAVATQDKRLMLITLPAAAH